MKFSIFFVESPQIKCYIKHFNKICVIHFCVKKCYCEKFENTSSVKKPKTLSLSSSFELKNKKIVYQTKRVKTIKH